MRWMAAVAMVLALAGTALEASTYQCYPNKDNDNEVQWLIVDGAKAKFDSSWTHRDYSYKPRLNKDYYRYDGYRGAFNNDGYSVDLLLHKDLVAGKPKSYLKLIARGEGYFNYGWTCYRRK